ncbi:Txe/YoeB family addiction module toxin [Staphylococcus schweitzeri]|uniref:Endoribonuclease YoeB n=1 Tax=Staphylococcus schweitzeri TaxID=1654388 RepID=A0A077VI87_9STAP|nr:Txe/YoeB family addiction module toxin [Staphylococcus schweitzeri]CDR27714.1 addiction module antitoxin [Staphylococcus schweitzeri]CDR60938.1 addiction module antitoxin [Staphylococcus schweitzeri]
MARLNITFSPQAFEDYEYFQQNDKKMVKKINELLKSIDRNGALKGIGKPEKLKSNLTGYYSRRINHEHRLVYTVDGNHIKIVSCKYHY